MQCFEIGQKVFWIVSNKKREGIFKQVLENGKAQVITTSFDGSFISLQCEVDCSLLHAQEV